MKLSQKYSETLVTLPQSSEVTHALDIFEAAIQAVHPSQLIPSFITVNETQICIANDVLLKKDINKFIVIAAGKAAAAMATATEQLLGNIISNGICITKYHHSLPLQYIRTIEAAHPVPDNNSLLAGEKVLELVKELSPNDIVLVLLSGGASSLMADAPESCTLGDVQIVFNLLLKSGATIHEINTVRKHLSSIKGGQLARAIHPAKVFTFILSDVVGDDVSTIASGPTVPDDSTFKDAFDILTRYKIWRNIPLHVQHHIIKGIEYKIVDTPTSSENYCPPTNLQIIGNNKMALQAAAVKAGELGYDTNIVNDKLQADASQFAQFIIHTYLNYDGIKPACFLFGGETTVKVNADGMGGRNQHLVLTALLALQKIQTQHKITIFSAGTDGTDGPTDAAGAVANNYTTNFDKAEIEESLHNFDAYNFFKKNGGLITTGATQTNVMDVIILLIN